MKTKIFLFAISAALCLAAVGCGDKTVSVIGVTIETPLELETGAKYTPFARVWPLDADNQGLSWRSDDATVAAVDPATGEITAVAVGETIVTVTTDDGGKTALCEVKVVEPAPDLLPLIPDPLFRQYCESWDTNRNGKLSPAEAEAVTEFDMRRTNNETKIESIEGIEYFTGLEVIDFAWNDIAEVDLSKNTELREIYAENNPLTSLEVGDLEKLAILWCRNCSLTTIDISKNKKIYGFNCEGNPGVEVPDPISPTGQHRVFVVNAWFDNLHIPSGRVPGSGTDENLSYYFSKEWTLEGDKKVTVDYQKVEEAGE